MYIFFFFHVHGTRVCNKHLNKKTYDTKLIASLYGCFPMENTKLITYRRIHNGLKSPCLAERPLSHLLNRVAEPTD